VLYCIMAFPDLSESKYVPIFSSHPQFQLSAYFTTFLIRLYLLPFLGLSYCASDSYGKVNTRLPITGCFFAQVASRPSLVDA